MSLSSSNYSYGQGNSLFHKSDPSVVLTLPSHVYFPAIVGFFLEEITKRRKNFVPADLVRSCGLTPNEWLEIQRGSRKVSMREFAEICRTANSSLGSVMGLIEDGADRILGQGIDVKYTEVVPSWDNKFVRHTLRPLFGNMEYLSSFRPLHSR